MAALPRLALLLAVLVLAEPCRCRAGGRRLHLADADGQGASFVLPLVKKRTQRRQEVQTHWKPAQAAAVAAKRGSGVVRLGTAGEPPPARPPPVPGLVQGAWTAAGRGRGIPLGGAPSLTGPMAVSGCPQVRERPGRCPTRPPPRPLPPQSTRGCSSPPRCGWAPRPRRSRPQWTRAARSCTLHARAAPTTAQTGWRPTR